MRVLVSGSNGLIGSALRIHLEASGNEVVSLRRGAPGSAGATWDPVGGRIDADLAGFDAVVHLGGASIADGRWTERRKRLIRDSRVDGTRLIAEAMAAASPRPPVLVMASAVGIYGDRGDEVLDEESGPGEGFLPEVCVAWEAAADPARDAGIRTCAMRFGVILSPAGGALRKMLTIFRLGIGGVVGNGRQHWCWAAIDDAVAATEFAMTGDVEGPFNVVTSDPPTNRVFTKTLGRVLRRPTVFPLPAFAARLALGGMADAALLASCRAEPRRLLEAGFVFRYPELEDALRHVLGCRQGA